jgi:hypothetical protein
MLDLSVTSGTQLRQLNTGKNADARLSFSGIPAFTHDFFNIKKQEHH